jgi:hypothetical protein
MSNRYESELSAFQDEVWSSLEKYGRKLGWGLSGIQPENWILLDHAVDELVKLRDQLRWRDAYGEPPTEEGIYLVINNDFDGGTSIHATYWKGKWPIGFTVPYWRPIGTAAGRGRE